MADKYFDKKIIQELFGVPNSLNTSKIKIQLSLLEKIFSKSMKKDSPKVLVNKRKHVQTCNIILIIV